MKVNISIKITTIKDPAQRKVMTELRERERLYQWALKIDRRAVQFWRAAKYSGFPIRLRKLDGPRQIY